MFLARFRNREASYPIGGKIYRGRVNRHRVLIYREPEEIYRTLIDSDQLKRWCPFEEISVEKMTPGETRVGTRFHFKLRFLIQPEWDTETIRLEKPGKIVNQFLNGIFEGGVEIWELNKKEAGTEVTHTLLYRISRWIYKLGWFLLGGERKHNELTELALLRLKSYLEKDRI